MISSCMHGWGEIYYQECSTPVYTKENLLEVIRLTETGITHQTESIKASLRIVLLNDRLLFFN